MSSSPSSLPELLSEAVLAQEDIDAAFESQLGHISGVEFSGTQVRLYRDEEAPLDLVGTKVATIADGQWTWENEEILPAIDGLRGPQTPHDDLIVVARHLYGDTPVFLASSASHTAVIAVEVALQPSPTRLGLATALRALQPTHDVPAALRGFARLRGLDLTATESGFRFSDGTEVTVRDGRLWDISGGLSLDDVMADAFYFSQEHQLYFEGAYPGASVKVDLQQAVAEVAGRFWARAVIVGTITAETFTWGWADPYLPPSPAATLHTFGRDHGIPALLTPTLPVEFALDSRLIEVAKPITGMWTHVQVPLSPSTAGLVLLDAPELRLPPATPETTAYTLGLEFPSHLDLQRGRAAYSYRRGIPLPPLMT